MSWKTVVPKCVSWGCRMKTRKFFIPPKAIIYLLPLVLESIYQGLRKPKESRRITLIRDFCIFIIHQRKTFPPRLVMCAPQIAQEAWIISASVKSILRSITVKHIFLRLLWHADQMQDWYSISTVCKGQESIILSNFRMPDFVSLLPSTVEQPDSRQPHEIVAS